MVIALTVLAAAFAATASADYIVRGEPIIRSCSGTGDECSIDVACASENDFCSTAGVIQPDWPSIVPIPVRGICTPVGAPHETYRKVCNASRPSVTQCGQGMACILGANATSGVCLPRGGGRAGDGCVMDSDCLGTDSPVGSVGGSSSTCNSDKTCAGIPLHGKCGGAIAPDSFFGCVAGTYCNSSSGTGADDGVCTPRIAEWDVCFPESILPSIREAIGGEVASTQDPCVRGTVCAGTPGRELGTHVPSRCVPFGFFEDGTDIAVLKYIPNFLLEQEPSGALLASKYESVELPENHDDQRMHHFHNASNTLTGPNIICSSGFAMAIVVNASHYSLQCADPVPAKYLTNDIGQHCRLDQPEVDLLPYFCVPGLGQGMSSQLAAPWQWRDDAAATILSLAQCRFGSVANGSSTAGGSCSRTSSMSPGSCAYYPCFDLMAQFTCLGTGLIWDRATWGAYKPGVPECFASQVHPPEDVFACVWRGQHMANCTELPGIGDAVGTCPYRPATDLSDAERDGITIAIVFGVVGLIVTGVAGFALRGARSKQWSERSRAWRQGGAELDYSAIDIDSSLSNGATGDSGSGLVSSDLRRMSGDRPLTLNGGGAATGGADGAALEDDTGFYSKGAGSGRRR